MSWIDASLLDVASLIVGFAMYIIQKSVRDLRWNDPKLFFEIANGFAVPPILVLIASALNSHLLDILKQGSRLTLVLAGVGALFALFDPRRSGETSE